MLMLAILLMTALTGAPTGAQDKKADDKAVAAKIDLLIDDATYKKSAAKEYELAGKLTKSTADNAGPASSYCMEIVVFRSVTVEREVNGKKLSTTEVVPETVKQFIYFGNKGDALNPYAGKTIKLTGKLLEANVAPNSTNIFWPGRLELWDPKAKVEEDEGCCVEEKDTALKIYAKTDWPFVNGVQGDGKKGQQFAIRSAAELVAKANAGAVAAGKQDGVEKKQTAEIAKLLGVDSIDWKKQMLVVVSGGEKSTGGWKIDIAAVTKSEKGATVSWALTPPTGVATQAFTHPALVALVDRCEGDIQFLMTTLGKTASKNP
jgi:hypothetical protein